MNFVPRLYLVISTFLLNVLGRSQPCQVGKPQSWFLPPNWS